MGVKYLCFVGASTVEGVGDEEGLGWPRRLCDMPPAAGRPIVAYNLGVRGNTAAAIAGRWRAECAARLPDSVDGTVVLSFGNNDTAETEAGQLRVPLEQTLQTVTAVVAAAKSWRRSLWIGPTPVREDRMPFRSALLGGVALTFRNDRLAALNAAYRDIAERHGVPYLDIFRVLVGDDRWADALGRRDGLHPNGQGYDLVARHVASWREWQALFA